MTDPRSIHLEDQGVGGMRSLGRLHAAYFTELVQHGVPEQQAAVIVAAYIAAMTIGIHIKR